MKIVIDIEKKHLMVFSLFLLLIGSIFVIAIDYNPSNNPGHSADDIGGGTISGPLTVIASGGTEGSALYVENSESTVALAIDGDLLISDHDDDNEEYPKIELSDIIMFYDSENGELLFCKIGTWGDSLWGCLGSEGFKSSDQCNGSCEYEN